ncbi:hypothetical protein H6P81_000832 [Aristolochia fimbriata]|uniref:Uncharacterized protein n=1 Tax=Aristolochia fimbriata TaxID=158543 RepID=A0AAV7F6U4_ARIFI|nr:hypothetical protein H6P81_000832 [Aristolochia fimbriata]
MGGTGRVEFFFFYIIRLGLREGDPRERLHGRVRRRGDGEGSSGEDEQKKLRALHLPPSSSPGSTPPLRREDHLEKGRLYFLVSRSSLDTNPSPSDLATLVANLTAIAKRGRKNIDGSRRRRSRLLSKRVRPVLVELGNGSTAGTHLMHSRKPRRARRRYWKPTLEMIQEDFSILPLS